MTLLKVEAASKRFGEVVALDGVNLDVKEGSRTAVVGPSGSGKSTLLRIIAGFETADSGNVVLDGEELCGNGKTVPTHKRPVGVVAQDGALFPHLSVSDNIGFGLNGEGRARIAELIEMVELDPSVAQRRPHQLSGGQQQRVALARALARKPKLMLLDEPFSALDSGLREHMRRAVSRVLDQSGMTAILVTHDQGEALSFADQIAVMRQGKLMQVGTPQDLYFRPIDRETALFIGDAVVVEADIDSGNAECVLGRIAVDRNDAGRARIMLRPEQFRLSGMRESSASAGCPGVITFVEFSGAYWTVGVSVVGGTPLTVKVSSSEAPAVGDQVRINVSGKAHILPG
jgi:iron(III) transport system ATP-binding protein